ncbi:MAG: SDR family oxidoreductase [Gammaproteobacteria bacterium]|nr:SDR family oxidoreductase [Gammaproteobacteria bacterium]
MQAKHILITGAQGFLGTSLINYLISVPWAKLIVGVDVRQKSLDSPKVKLYLLDIRDPYLPDLMLKHHIDTVVHLASVVTPTKTMTQETMYDIDVNGTHQVLVACQRAGVKHLVVSSSGAAYGYYPDNPPWIDESTPLRGHPRFAYAHHKMLVEKMLCAWRHQHPELKQTVFRIGTILGHQVNNQLTDLFTQKRLLRIVGSPSPFVFIWDEDVVSALAHALTGAPAGCYNLAGDGYLTIDDLARKLAKKTWSIPAKWLAFLLTVGKYLGLTVYGPEQVDFLRYRPVLSNTKLKTEFGFTPQKTSEQAFDAFVKMKNLV